MKQDDLILEEYGAFIFRNEGNMYLTVLMPGHVMHHKTMRLTDDEVAMASKSPEIASDFAKLVSDNRKFFENRFLDKVIYPK